VNDDTKSKEKYGQAPHQEDILGSGGITPHIPELSTRWR